MPNGAIQNSSTEKFYRYIIDDVINNVRDEIVKEDGLEENVLEDLRRMWIEKLFPVQDWSVPCWESMEVETLSPTVDLVFPLTPLQTPIPETGMTYSSTVNIPNVGNPYAPDEYSSTSDSPYAFHLPGAASSPLTGTNYSSAFNIGTPYPPDEYSSTSNPNNVKTVTRILTDFFTMPSPQYSSRDYIPQQDGAGDELCYDFKTYDFQGVGDEDCYNVVNTLASDMQAPVPEIEVVDNSDGEALNENDDDHDGEGEEPPTFLVLCQFNKVKHAKTRWRCTFKAGTMYINEKDFVFSRATGEFEFLRVD